MDALELASLLCSRLCHDLMSPVGALNNGVELLADEDDRQMREKCIDLVGESARTSANKLKFFRLAFGAAGGFGDSVDTAEARTALEGMFGAEKRIELGWMVSEQKLPKGALKLLLNLALIAGDSLVRGGRLDIGAERANGSLEIAIRAEGPRVILDPVLRMTLLGEQSETVDSRAAAAWLAQAIVQQAGGTIQLSHPSGELLIIGAQVPGQSGAGSGGPSTSSGHS
jgi:histidine phosphotransferase ChpT